MADIQDIHSAVHHKYPGQYRGRTFNAGTDQERTEFDPERDGIDELTSEAQALALEEWLADSVKRDAQVEIERLEALITNRRLRDHALGTGGDWLEDQEALIAVERAKL